jgi:hypothetical protein
MADLANEVHHRLTPSEMAEIREYREKLAYKSVDETYKLYYEWAKTGRLSRREHTLLGIYIFSEH